LQSRSSPSDAEAGNTCIFLTKKLNRAYNQDKFKKFKSLLTEKKWNFISPRYPNIHSLGGNCLEKLLSSNSSKAAKYIGFLIDHFNLNSDEHFNDSEYVKSCIKTAADSKNYQIFFSYLMFDWYAPKSNKPSNYCLLQKNKKYFEVKNEHLLKRLLKVFETDTEIAYKQVAVKIIHQFMHEFDLAAKTKVEIESEIEILERKETEAHHQKEKLSTLQTKKDKIEDLLRESPINDESLFYALEIKRTREATLMQTNQLNPSQAIIRMEQACIESILMVLIAFPVLINIAHYKTEFKALNFSENAKQFFDHVFLLKEKKSEEFLRSFNENMEKARKYGAVGMQTKMRMQNQLLLNVAESNELYKASEYIFSACPVVGASILSIWLETNDFHRYFFKDSNDLKLMVR
jgi:hypothetical protein